MREIELNSWNLWNLDDRIKYKNNMLSRLYNLLLEQVQLLLLKLVVDTPVSEEISSEAGTTVTYCSSFSDFNGLFHRHELNLRLFTAWWYTPTPFTFSHFNELVFNCCHYFLVFLFDVAYIGSR